MRRQLGTGELAFARAKERLATWGTHRSRLMAVDANGRSDELGTTVLLGVGLGPARLWFGCRVVEVIDEEFRTGFSYATCRATPNEGWSGSRLHSVPTVLSRVGSRHGPDPPTGLWRWRVRRRGWRSA